MITPKGTGACWGIPGQFLVLSTLFSTPGMSDAFYFVVIPFGTVALGGEFQILSVPTIGECLVHVLSKYPT